VTLRVLQSVAVVCSAATLAFVLLQLAPGDPATALGEGVAPELRAAIRARYGLDDSIATTWAGRATSSDPWPPCWPTRCRDHSS
jgi:ABC-type dipeptide/oligopeptide/nickel transport system permease component